MDDREIIEKLIAQISDTKVNEVLISPHFVIVDSLNVGLASVGRQSDCVRIEDAGVMHKKSTRILSQKAFSNIAIESAIGFATINSATNYEAYKQKFFHVNALEILKDKGKNKNVSIIGHFPFTDSLREGKFFKNLWVFEMFPRDSNDLGVDEYEQFLPRSDVILITAMTLVNHTFSKVTKLAQKSFNIMIGPSTPISPVLFDYGLDVLCGSIVVDKALAKSSFLQGASFRQAQGIEHIAFVKD